MSVSYEDNLMDKVNNLNTKFEDFANISRLNFERVNHDTNELKGIVQSTLQQATSTNHRVFKLEDRADKMEKVQKECPAKGISQDLKGFKKQMQFMVFLNEHWKIILPAVAAFAGITIAAYHAFAVFFEKLV